MRNVSKLQLPIFGLCQFSIKRHGAVMVLSNRQNLARRLPGDFHRTTSPQAKCTRNIYQANKKRYSNSYDANQESVDRVWAGVLNALMLFTLPSSNHETFKTNRRQTPIRDSMLDWSISSVVGAMTHNSLTGIGNCSPLALAQPLTWTCPVWRRISRNVSVMLAARRSFGNRRACAFLVYGEAISRLV